MLYIGNLPSTKSKGDYARIQLRHFARNGKKALWHEGHGISISVWVMKHTPAVC